MYILSNLDRKQEIGYNNIPVIIQCAKNPRHPGMLLAGISAQTRLVSPA